MPRLYQSLMLLIAGATEKELARHVHYLKIENQILRARLPARIAVTPQERRRLVRFAARLGGALDHLATIVHPDTIRRWLREQRPSSSQAARPGRPPSREEIRTLVLKLARENAGWGYTRILGELRKLGITPPSRSTVKRLLVANGFDPAPRRGEGTWDEFLKRHADTLWQADFLSVRSLTSQGVRHLFVIVFIHVGSRRLMVSPSTAHPDAAWVRRQAAAFVAQLPADQRGKFYLQHDRDRKFSEAFAEPLRAAGGKIVKLPCRSPNLNAFVERVIQTIRVEALNHFILFGPRHLDHILAVFVRFYNERRPHQARDNRTLPVANDTVGKRWPVEAEEPELVKSLPLAEVGCERQLGGLLKHYYRRAA